MLDLTTSEINCYLTCPYKHHLQYRLMLRRARTERPLFDGDAIHQALDMWYQGESAEKADALIINLYRIAEKNIPEDEIHAHQCAREKIRSLFAGYVWRWQSEPLKLIASERKFTMPISYDISLSGKIDKLVKLPDGRLALIEHKTTSQDIASDSLYWQRLRMDLQVSNYLLSTKAETILYDVIHKPSFSPKQVPLTDSDGNNIVVDTHGDRVYTQDGKPRKTGDSKLGFALQNRIETPSEYGARIIDDIAKRPETYYARREISRTKEQLEYALDDIGEVGCLISNGLHPRNTNACVTQFSRCPYYDICSAGGWDDSKPLPEGFQIVETKHEELEGLEND